MASRSSILLFSAVLAVIPGVAMGQGESFAAPPEVDKALRANVTEFFQDFIDRKFRQALSLVADDTQDQYFGSNKAEIGEFKIDDINYNDSTHATVKITVKVILHLRAEGFLQDTTLPTDWDTHWKIENGKWLYYEPPAAPNLWVTPMGPSNLSSIQTTGKAAVPPKINAETMASEAQRILRENGVVTSVTPKEVKFTKDKPGTAKLLFRNGQPGQVQVSVEGITEQNPFLASKVNQPNVNAGAETSIDIIYDPTSGVPSGPITLGVMVAPFDQIFPITVSFDAN